MFSPLLFKNVQLFFLVIRGLLCDRVLSQVKSLLQVQCVPRDFLSFRLSHFIFALFGLLFLFCPLSFVYNPIIGSSESYVRSWNFLFLFRLSIKFRGLLCTRAFRSVVPETFAGLSRSSLWFFSLEGLTSLEGLLSRQRMIITLDC